MSYRRMGDGPRGGNRSFSQPFQSGPVNPWQGASNMNQGGILSQLTSNPQLALALTSLLQPQQQQPPSLLSLNTSPAFSDRGDYGRFNINRGRDFRRPEPYYKNRGGFGGDRRRRGSPKRDRKNDNKKPDNKKFDKDKKEEKPKVKEEGDVSMEDDEKESKRDWKDEKNQAEGKEGDDDGKTKEGEKEGKYSGVPRKYLNCFVCNKQMWDGESMGKHVRGRAHQEMMKAVEESIHICVNILRENMRLTEDRKMIEWNRQNRLKKYGKRPRDSDLSHCNMCDLKFMGKIVAHRRTEGHQRLKSYLHPKCKVCDKEFPSRLDWIDHRLTPEHLRSLHKSVEDSDQARDGQIITEDDEEDMDLKPLLDENLQMESEDAILEVSSPLDGFQNRLPAYKPNRPVGTESLKEFSGWMCEFCNRSFVDEANAKDHLKSPRHYYRFVDVIKEKFEEKERKEKAEKEAAEKKKKAEETVKSENGDVEENGEKEEGDGDAEAEEETEGDTEMYDPAETTEEKDNADEEEEETAEADEVKVETAVEEEVEEEEEEKPVVPEPKKVEIVKEVKKEPPPPAPKTPAKKMAGPKSKRGRK